MAIAAGHDEIGLFLPRKSEKLAGRRCHYISLLLDETETMIQINMA
jgi:hypothetical protein